MTTETTDPTESPAPPKHLFVLGFPDQAHAERAVAGLKSLQRDQFLEVRDHAIITKSAEGKLHVAENTDADHTAKHGAVTGGLAGRVRRGAVRSDRDRGRRRRGGHRGRRDGASTTRASRAAT